MSARRQDDRGHRDFIRQGRPNALVSLLRGIARDVPDDLGACGKQCSVVAAGLFRRYLCALLDRIFNRRTGDRFRVDPSLTILEILLGDRTANGFVAPRVFTYNASSIEALTIDMRLTGSTGTSFLNRIAWSLSAVTVTTAK